jgi:hypothetical protein
MHGLYGTKVHRQPQTSPLHGLHLISAIFPTTQLCEHLQLYISFTSSSTSLNWTAIIAHGVGHVWVPLIMARPHSRGQVTYRSRVLEMLLTQGRKDSNGCGASNAVRSMTFCGLLSELMTICRTCKNTQTMLSRKASGQAINTRTRIQHMELQQEVSILPMTKSTVLGRVRALSYKNEVAQVVSTGNERLFRDGFVHTRHHICGTHCFADLIKYYR